MSSQQKQNGLTLIELMISMLLGTLMILGATSMFTANKRVYKEVDFQGRLAENARFAMEIMIRDLRMAGFRGCAVQQEINNNLNVLNAGAIDPTQLLSFITQTTGAVETNSIEGSEGGGPWFPSASADATGAGTALLAADTRVATFGQPQAVTMIPLSDGFTVRFMEDTNTNLCTDMANTADDLSAQAQAGANIAAGTFVQSGLYAAADCEATDIFQLGADDAATPFVLTHPAGGGPPGNITNALSKQYTLSNPGNCTASPVDIMSFQTRRYFIATDPDGNFPGLYRQIYGSNPNNANVFEEYAERLVDGVENMQILYGVDTSGNRVANAYLAADAVANWANVVSVKLALLFATVQEDFTASFDVGVYQLLNAAPFDPTPAADDRRRRRIVEATVSLRNRQLADL